jgi:hypothetical protein
MRIGGRFRLVVAAATLLLPQPARAEVTSVGQWVAVADLDGDGTADLVQWSGGIGLQPEVQAFSGATGHLLWQLTPPAFVGNVVAASLGSAQPGVLLMGDGGAGTSVTAVGRDGTIRWHRLWHQAISPDAFLVGDFVAGPDDELVVTLEAGDHDRGGVRSAEVVDAGTGLTATVLKPETYGRWDALPEAAGDLDGDGAVDLAWVEQPVAGNAVVRAYAGTGRLLWESSALPYVPAGGYSGGGGTTPVGDVTGDGRPDLTVLSEDASQEWETTLLSGATGRPVWTRPGTTTLRSADVSRDGYADVVLVAHTGVTGGPETTIRAYGRDGRAIYSRGLPYDDIGPAGDVTGDGVPDFLGEWRDADEPQAAHTGPGEGIVDGRTGRVLRTNATPREHPLGASVDCRGADTATAADGTDTVLVRALDGRTGRSLWSIRMPVERGYPDVAVTPMPRSKGRCADVLVVGSGYAAMVSPDGHVRWSLGTAPR